MTDTAAVDTDYTITETHRTPGGRVIYHFTDRRGQRYHVIINFEHSVPEFADLMIRRMIATHRPTKVPT